VAPIGRVGEKSLRHLVPIGSGGKGEVILALEVMEKAALRHACLGTNVIDGRSGVALLTDDMQRRVQEPCLGFMTCLTSHASSFHTIRYG
jgi:hypothetical protein